LFTTAYGRYRSTISFAAAASVTSKIAVSTSTSASRAARETTSAFGWERTVPTVR
jgi:hypothetical protein